MGSESWSVWVPYTKSVKQTLKVARQQALDELGYASEGEALEACDADGTASPLDIFGFSDAPEPASCWTLDADTLEAHFGSAKPSKDAVEDGVDELLEELGRGESLCVVAWKGGKPAEVLFAGWSFD